MGDHGWRDFSMQGDLVKRRIKFDTNGRTIIHEASQRVAELFADNRERKAREVERSSSLWDGRSMVMVGRIPLALVEQWRREGIDVYKNANDPEVQKKINGYLNSTEYEKLRTAPGKV